MSWSVDLFMTSEKPLQAVAEEIGFSSRLRMGVRDGAQSHGVDALVLRVDWPAPARRRYAADAALEASARARAG